MLQSVAVCWRFATHSGSIVRYPVAQVNGERIACLVKQMERGSLLSSVNRIVSKLFHKFPTDDLFYAKIQADALIGNFQTLAADMSHNIMIIVCMHLLLIFVLEEEKSCYNISHMGETESTKQMARYMHLFFSCR